MNTQHFLQLAEQAQLETVQLAEQETARQLISEASWKLSEAVQGSGHNVKGAAAMLSAGNEKLNVTAKQLVEIKQEREKEWSETEKTPADSQRQE